MKTIILPFYLLQSTSLALAKNQEATGKPISKKTDSALEKTGKQALFASKELLPVPFGLKAIEQALADPEKQATSWDYVLPLLGMYATHENEPQERKQKGTFHLPGVQRGGMRLPGERRRR